LSEKSAFWDLSKVRPAGQQMDWASDVGFGQLRTRDLVRATRPWAMNGPMHRSKRPDHKVQDLCNPTNLTIPSMGRFRPQSACERLTSPGRAAAEIGMRVTSVWPDVRTGVNVHWY
jgi:hypothetical protein